MVAALDLAGVVGMGRAAEVFDVPRASLYRARQPAPTPLCLRLQRCCSVRGWGRTCRGRGRRRGGAESAEALHVD